MPPRAAPADIPPRAPLRARGILGGLTLSAILLLALALRLHGIGFGLPALNDPDELMFELGAIRMLSGPTLNPGWFGHPATTTMYLLALTHVLVFAGGWLAGWFTSIGDLVQTIYADPTWMILPGRVVMALFGIGCVFLTWRLGRELLGKPAGLIAAALLAVNPVHVMWSQVIRSDIMATFFLLLCMLAAVRIARAGRWRDHVLAALWLGLAMATKWPFAVGALAIAGAAALRIAGGAVEPARAARRALACMALAPAFLLLASPYLVLDHATLLRNLHGEAQAHHLGATGGGPLANAWWYLSGPLRQGLGWAGLALAAWGTMLLARHREGRAVILSVAFGFFLLICAQRLVWDRWALPLMPLLSIAAGHAAVRLWSAIRGRLPRRARIVSAAIAIVAILLPPIVDARAGAAARLNDTRQQAARWVGAHVPAGSRVLIEHFAFDMLPQPVTFLFPMGAAGCVDARAMLHGRISYAPIETARGGRSNVDYGTLPPGKRASCRADYAILAHYDRYRQERGRFPAEYASYRELLGRGEVVATFLPSTGRVGGPAVRIVRISR